MDRAETNRDSRPPRILFLDDDSRRAEAFLEWHPGATWIQTAEDCVGKLADAWDEVYLDHDLGGEHYVDVKRADCGMEVVRWLCKEPRAHLIAARFVIHSHNLAAAMMMVLLMRETGYNAEFQPFGFSLELDPLIEESGTTGSELEESRLPGAKPPSFLSGLGDWVGRGLRKLLGGDGRSKPPSL